MLAPGDFFGEGCLAGQSLRMATATALVPTTVLKIHKREMMRTLHEQSALSDRFIAHMLTRNIRFKRTSSTSSSTRVRSGWREPSCYWRRYGQDGDSGHVLPAILQETLAEMIGTTRSRVNLFMNKFRKLGFVRYNGRSPSTARC